MSAKIRFLVLSLSLMAIQACAGVFPHPYYLSVLQIRYNATEHKLQGSLRIFVNDLEAALASQEKKTVDLIHPADDGNTKIVLLRYLQGRLLLENDGKTLGWELLGFEREEDSIWIYLESAMEKAPRQLTVHNRILCDEIAQQSNIIHVEIDGKRQSSKLNCPDSTVEFRY